MTQITGQIYQLTNGKTGSQLVNRFPKTVMEAVLGLNSYLQNQFSSLADIYMPIEGITESKPLQEFVYRLCPSSIKAKSVSLDRIYGKTLAWNQLVKNGNFSEGTLYWTSSDVTISASGNKLTAYFPGVSNRLRQGDLYWGLGHKHYAYAEVTSSVVTNVSIETDYGWNKITTYCPASVKTRIKGILPATAQGEYSWLQIFPDVSDCTLVVENVVVVDLTLLYGSEIDGMTDAQILAKFESEFPGYHSHEPGKLISNDAESIETVGFNQWDEEWELGAYEASTGEKKNATNKIRSTNFIPVIPNATYFILNTGVQTICAYDLEKNFIGTITVDLSHFLIPANCSYITFNNNSAYGTTYNHDICINLSDPAKNGTYEPYRKSTMQLGLNNLKVKSHNIWDEEWEAGYLGYSESNMGQPIPASNTWRCKNHIPVTEGQTYYIKHHAVGTHYVWTYDSNKTGLAVITMGSGVNEVVIPSGVKYIKIADDGSAYNHDICINVSSSFNGQYEPHGILTKTGGLKGAGSVYDEIVSNKLAKRFTRIDMSSLSWNYGAGISGQLWFAALPKFKQGGRGVSDKYVQNTSQSANDCANGEFNIASSTNIFVNLPSNTAPTGYLDYELATPVEYDLVSPLVPTVKAGETEARISPNADGLSAPMVADMTYDAQANNDSASAQYALTAGRLLNSHKLWGQDFDGTQDVTGDMTGVGNIAFAASGKNIASLLYFDTTQSRVGVGAAPGAYKLDVGGTFRASGNSTVGGTLDVSGAMTAPSLKITGTLGALSVKLNANYTSAIKFENNIGTIGFLGLTENCDPCVIESNQSTIKFIWNSGNSNKSTVDWAAKNLSAAGTLSVTSTSTLTGRVGIGGAPDSTNALKVTGVVYATTGMYSDGYITAGAVNSSSDARLKDNITSVQNAMETIMSLKPSEWIWNEKHHLNGQKGAGLVAQEVEKVLPFAVAKEGEYLSLNYYVFHAYEIAGLQNHEERIKALEAENAELRKRLGA